MISRKKMLVISITILMMLLLSSILGYADSNFKPKYATTTVKVNLRNKANLDYSSIVKTLPAGTYFKVVGEISSFYIVQLQSNEIGLVSKSYSTLKGSSLPDALVYESVASYYATITGDGSNVRSGPGTQFKSYGKLYAGDKVQVIGKINDFNLIITSSNLVGMVRNDLMKKITTPTTPPSNNGNVESNEQQIVLDLINAKRKENGLPILIVDTLLQSTAQTKAADMVKNNYFSHTSPTYGSPFNMMKNAGITYKTAGENIAGNPSLQNAVESWMNSESHRKNILSNAYNFAGIGVEKSKTYGYVIVAMFIGK